MYNNETRLRKIAYLCNKGDITKEKGLDLVFSLNLTDEELASFFNQLEMSSPEKPEVIEEKKPTWEDQNKSLKEKNREKAEETRKRQAERDAVRLKEEEERRLEEEAKKREEELKRIDEEKEKDFNEKIEFLKSLKDSKGNDKYRGLSETKEKIEAEEDLAEYGRFENIINKAYESEQKRLQQEANVKESQKRYKSMSPEERQAEVVNRYGIDSEQGQKAKETSERINREIQKDNYEKLVQADSIETEYVVQKEPEVTPISNSEKDSFNIINFIEKNDGYSNAELEYVKDKLGLPADAKVTPENIDACKAILADEMMKTESRKKVISITTAEDKLKELVDSASKHKIAIGAAVGIVALAALINPVVGAAALAGVVGAGAYKINQGRKL